MPVAILPTDLAELARPVRQNTGKARVRQARVGRSPAAVKASPNRPAPVRAILRRRVQAKGVLCLENAGRRKLIPRAPEQLGTEQERMINGAAQRLPAKRRVR